jgi:large subunit ribosomal protein L10
MPTEKKVREVEELSELLARSTGVVAADYRGLSVHDTTVLRRQLRDAGVALRVIKNTLFRLAAERAGRPELAELAEGATALAIGFDDPLTPVKAVYDYQRQARNTFASRKAYLDGQIVLASQFARLANLPGRDVMLAEFAGIIASPITTFSWLLQAKLQELTGLLSARADQLASPEAAS